MAGGAWRKEETARRSGERRRSLIPFGAEQIRMLLQPPRLTLDPDCGDGILVRGLLDVYPDARAVLLDHAEPLLSRARAAAQAYEGRCDVQWADLARPINGLLKGGRRDLVVSGYANHLLPHERKQALHGEVFQLLHPGGRLVNLEHVASATSALEGLFQKLYADFTTAVSGRPRHQVEAELHGALDKKDNILPDVDPQLQWLRTLGFQHVDCCFTWLELAVFGGARSAV